MLLDDDRWTRLYNNNTMRLSQIQHNENSKWFMRGFTCVRLHAILPMNADYSFPVLNRDANIKHIS